MYACLFIYTFTHSFSLIVAGGAGGGGGGGRRGEFRLVVHGLPISGSWQDLKDHMRDAGECLFGTAAAATARIEE